MHFRKPTHFMNFDFDFFAIFLVIALAWLVPMAISMIRVIKIPAVVFEMIVGFIIGRNVLNWLPQESYMEFLGLTGFIFLMFLSGLECDVNHIINTLPRRKLTVSRFFSNPLLVGIALFVGTLSLAYTGAYLLSSLVPIHNIWFFALIISTSSIGVILPVLKERAEISGRYGQMIVLGAVVADIISIILFTITASGIKHGFDYKVFLILLLFLAFYISYYAGRWLMRISFFKRVLYQLSHAAAQIKVRGTMALIFAFLVISQMVDAEVIIGAFLAGLLLSIFMPKERSILLVKLDGMGYGFFIPIFFIMVGANLDLSALQEFDNSFMFLGALLVTLYAVKIIPALLWTRLFGLRKAISAGFLISSRLSLIIAASQIGLKLNIIDPATNAAFIIMAVVTCLLSPLIYAQLNPLALVRREKTIVIGGTEVAELLARRMKLHGKSVVIVEGSEERFLELQRDGLEVFFGNAADKSIYETLVLEPQNYVVVLTGSDIRNLRISEMLRNELNHEKVITMADKDKNVNLLENLDVDKLDKTQTIATSIENLIFRPTTYHAVFESFEAFRVEDIEVVNFNVDGILVKDIPFHQDGSLMLVKRGHEMHIPHGNTYIKVGDVVTVFGNDTALQDFRNKFT
ncbi:MAG: monovalent cation:proton antiporter family protein [Bacteroidetes bacterium]|nr:monovalent cation:proton antiporter family protein [Bacteroidota bacterium]